MEKKVLSLSEIEVPEEGYILYLSPSSPEDSFVCDRDMYHTKPFLFYIEDLDNVFELVSNSQKAMGLKTYYMKYRLTNVSRDSFNLCFVQLNGEQVFVTL